MKKLLVKLRGLMGVGVTWGALWSAIGAGIGALIGLIHPEVWQWTNPIFEWSVGMGLYGLASGFGFGSLLSLREGRKTLLDLSLRRTALWGALGGAVMPLFFGALGMFAAGTTVADVLGAIAVTALLGGTFAPVSVAIAQRAEFGAGTDRKPLSSTDLSERALPPR